MADVVVVNPEWQVQATIAGGSLAYLAQSLPVPASRG
jgi:hypothetical protein